MNTLLSDVVDYVYTPCKLSIVNLMLDSESLAYAACTFELNSLKVICRHAKQTPKKTGQFVTFWKRSAEGITEPYHHDDDFDVYVVNVVTHNQRGQFVFPKSELIKQGIVSTNIREGKRGFRVYPIWTHAQNKQAQKTQQWQLKYFYEIHETVDFEKVFELYSRTL